MSGVAGVRYFYDGVNRFDAPGRDSILSVTAPQTTARVNPTRGTYLSNSNLYTGLLPGWTPADLTDVMPGTSGYTVVTTPNTVYNNMLFWGGIKVNATGVVFNNCAFAGPKPTLQFTDGILRQYGNGSQQYEINDSLVDPELWLDPDLAGYSTWSVPTGYRYPGDRLEYFREYNRSAGVHGGSITLRRVEIRHCVDAFNSVQSNWITGLFTLVEDCWFHSSHYYRDPLVTTQSGGWHSDGFQFSVGKDITIRGGFIGGVRGDYGNDANVTPAPDELHYNPGTDPHGNPIIIKQEKLPQPTSDLLANILIEDVVFQGGSAGVNHFYSTTTPNPMTTVTLRRLKFVQIPPAANGQTAYIYRNSAYASCYEASTMRIITLNGSGGWTDVGQAPINNG